MYRFARRPRWVLSHVLVLLLVVVLVSLGLWQLHRLDQRRDRNALVEARSEQATAEVAEVVGVDAPLDEGEDVRFRPVTATGVYEAGSDVLVRNRTLDGSPGSWLLATLRLEDGDAIVVGRGWVPVTGEQEPEPEWLAPAGPVRVEGLLEPTQERGRFGSVDPEQGRLERVARVDLARLDEQVEGDLYPVWIQASTEEPAAGELPAPVPPPELGDGPHLGYAVQWFAFAAIAVLGYPLVLRRVARQQAAQAGPEGADGG